jgi:peroxiredoxin
MIRYAAVALALVGLALIPTARADIKIGDPAPAFSGLEGVDGKSKSLDDYKNKDVLVVVITCNHCPVAVQYEDRIIEFTKKYAGPDSKVGLVAINVNNLEQDKLPAMKERAKEKGFNFDYLYDPSQKIARELGAKVTPEFYVFNKERKLVYHGAMDDSNNPASVKTNFLAPAVEAALAGSTPQTAETKARGCSVKFDSK